MGNVCSIRVLRTHNGNRIVSSINDVGRTSLVVQWLRLHTSNAGDAGLIPGWETGSLCHMVWPLKKKWRWEYWTSMCRGMKSNLYLTLYIFNREGNGNPLQYPCLENPMDGGAW